MGWNFKYQRLHSENEKKNFVADPALHSNSATRSSTTTETTNWNVEGKVQRLR